MKSFKEFANSFQKESKLRLDGIEALCKKMGNPQENMKFIHIAGTNGKGSVCAFLTSILEDAGFKCGKYISPNMIDVCERISINGENITKEDMDSLLDKVSKAVAEIKEEKGVEVTQFEIWTAIAFMYFKEKECDIVVLETGLGGRLDATNVIKNPALTIITKIGMDHTDYLGETIYEIAGEKAGIIKENTPLITIKQEDDAQRAIKEKAKEMNSPITLTDAPKNQKIIDGCEVFDYKDFCQFKTSLLGLHQSENAALAIEAALLMGIEEKFIRSGLLRAKNMGRFERIEENFIFDGAHNVDATIELVRNIERYFPEKKLSIVYGAMADKDLFGIMKVFEENGYREKAEFFTVTVKDNPRAQTAQILSEMFMENGFRATPCKSIHEAIKKARNDDRVTIICGSLYLYKDLKNI